MLLILSVNSTYLLHVREKDQALPGKAGSGNTAQARGLLRIGRQRIFYRADCSEVCCLQGTQA